jgi:hypothetical protein
MHRVDVRELGLVETLDGMSGSPVFCREAPGGLFQFAGVLLRGGAAGRIAQFVEARVPVWLIADTLRRERNAAKRDRRAWSRL